MPGLRRGVCGADDDIEEERMVFLWKEGGGGKQQCESVIECSSGDENYGFCSVVQ